MFTYKEEGSSVLYKKVSHQMSGNKAAEGVSSSAHNQRNLLNIYYENQQVRQLLLVNPIIKRL